MKIHGGCRNSSNLCEARWASGADSLCTFRTAYSVVIQALESLSSDKDGKSRGYLCLIIQFDFIIALCAAEHVFLKYRGIIEHATGQRCRLDPLSSAEASYSRALGKIYPRRAEAGKRKNPAPVFFPGVYKQEPLRRREDLIEAANEPHLVINVPREERNDELVWEELFERAKTMAAEWNIEPTLPRLATN